MTIVRTLSLVPILPFLLAFVACSDNENTGAASSSSSSSGEHGTSSGEQASSSGSATSSGGSSSGGSSGSAGTSAFPCSDGLTETTVRIVTGNISSGNKQNYDDGEGLRIFKGLAPDIALVQEMNYKTNSDADFQEFSNVIGQGFVFFHGSPNGPGKIPNGIVSRYPLTGGELADPQSGDTRSFVWARIDVPGDHDVLAISVHLAIDSGNRDTEVTNLLNMVSNLVQPGDLIVLGGDFNTKARTDASVNALSARFVTAGPYPVDQNGNDGTSANRKDPYDWVIGNGALDERSRPTVVGSMTYEHGLVFDSRGYPELSAVPGVLDTDSNATAMQHMAVTRTFALCQ